MSVSIHSLFTPDELTLELEWLEVCDMLLRDNFVKQNVKRALQLAAASNHPGCQWLTGLFSKKTVTTVNEVRDVFLAEKKSPASLCFAGLLSYPWDEVHSRHSLLRQSADLGHPLAQAKMADILSEEGFRFASAAASQRVREGFHWLGCCYHFNSGCGRDLEKARECYLIAAQLGQVLSMIDLGQLSDESDPQRWVWWGRAAVLGNPCCFLTLFSAVVEKFNSGSENGAVVFQIGKALSEHVNVERKIIFGNNDQRFETDRFDKRIGPANSAISFYRSQISSCRRSVDAWTHVGIRYGVVKDIRVLIGKLVWTSRNLALYRI
jgi:hypothetical protein